MERSNLKYFSYHWVWLIVALMCSMGSVCAAPSFDCRTASKPDEQTICGSAELSALEQTMAEKFIAARITGDADRNRTTARDLLKQRRDCKTDAACIRAVLAKGIAFFNGPQSRPDEQKHDDRMPVETGKPSTSTFELKEETSTERCDVAVCNQDCVKYYGSSKTVGDHGPLPIAVCQSLCADQKPFCLAHDGVAIQIPDIAPSSMGKLEILFCAKHKNADVCEGER